MNRLDNHPCVKNIETSFVCSLKFSGLGAKSVTFLRWSLTDVFLCNAPYDLAQLAMRNVVVCSWEGPYGRSHMAGEWDETIKGHVCFCYPFVGYNDKVTIKKYFTKQYHCCSLPFSEVTICRLNLEICWLN